MLEETKTEITISFVIIYLIGGISIGGGGGGGRALGVPLATPMMRDDEM